MTRIGVLLRHGVRRLSASVRRPTAGGTIGVLLPSLLLVVGVVAAGARGGARLESTQDGVTLGVLLGSPVAFVAYSVIFRMRDESFLRRLGVEPRVLYLERALRLLAFAVGVSLLALLGYGAAGSPPIVFCGSLYLSPWSPGGWRSSSWRWRRAR